jgi:glutaminyl-tRNA synthetase
MSKRKLLELVTNKYVSGWDDPRMPTIAGIRRRGYTPEAVRDFAERIGVAKADNLVDIAMLEHCLREDLNKKAQRIMAVIDPIKVVIDNYPADKVEYLEAVNNPEDDSMGKREIPFSKELWIERSDFMEAPPRGYFRLSPGSEVRFKHAYYIKCVSVEKDSDGNVSLIHCTYDPDTRGGWSNDGRKVKGTIHWVSAGHCIKCDVRLYDHLFTKENPDDLGEDEDYRSNLNPDSLKIAEDVLIEPVAKNFSKGDKFQFERTGYFIIDPDSTDEKIIFNRTVALKDSWGKIAKKLS